MPRAQDEESKVKHDHVFLWRSLSKVVENSSTNRVRVVLKPDIKPIICIVYVSRHRHEQVLFVLKVTKQKSW